MTDPEQSPRPSSEARARPASLRSAPSPSPQAEAPSPLSLHEESTIKPQRPRPFQPLFTLVSDNTATRATPQTHHPTVHYVFSDDDPDELVQALAAHREALPSAPTSHGGSRGGVAERAILLDLVARADGEPGYEVAWASSLSGDWAVTGASVARIDGAEADAAHAGSDGGGTGALMLRIEGLSIENSATPGGGKTPSPNDGELHSSDGSGANRDPTDEYAALVDEFEKRMGVLKKVVGVSEERQRKIAEAEALEEQEGDETQVPDQQVPDVDEDGGGD